MSDRKAFRVWATTAGEQPGDLVFATSEAEASREGIAKGEACRHVSPEQVRAERVPGADHLRDGRRAYIESNTAVLRQAGWDCEGARHCACCGLSDLNDDRWRVCNQCGGCPDCGHDFDCGVEDDSHEQA